MRPAIVSVAALAAVLGALYLLEALRYGRGTLDDPGPGLYPLVVGALLVLASVGAAVEAIVGHSGETVAWPVGAPRRRMIALVVATIGYLFLLPWAGHPLAGTLVTLVALELMGQRGWPLKIALAVAIGLGSHYLFAVVLGVPLPRGVWFR